VGEITVIPKETHIWTPDDITFKSTQFNRATLLGSDFDILETWGECRIDKTGELDLAISVIPSAYNRKQLQIESKFVLSDNMIDQILNDVNEKFKYNPDVGLVYDSSLVLLAFLVKKQKETWMATQECLERMTMMGISEVRQALEVKDQHSIVFTIGNYIFYANKTFAMKPIVALAVDYYADRAIPVEAGFQTSHKEITLEGMGLMVRLLNQTLGQSGSNDFEIKRTYEVLRNKKFLPNVPITWNTKTIEVMKTDQLTNLWKDYINLMEIRRSKSQTTDLRGAIQNRLRELEDGEEPEVIDAITIPHSDVKATDNFELKVSVSTKQKHWQLTKITSDMFFLSEILLNKIEPQEVMFLYQGTYPVIPDCNIEIKYCDTILNILEDNIVCGIIEDGTLRLVIDDYTITEEYMAIIESILSNQEKVLEEIEVSYTTSPEGQAIQIEFNSMIKEVAE